METFLGILGLLAFVIICAVIRSKLDQRQGKQIAADFKVRVEMCLTMATEKGISQILQHEGVDHKVWKDWFIVFALLMFVSDAAKSAAGKVDTISARTYGACCGVAMRHMVSDNKVIDSIDSVASRIMGLKTDEDIDVVKETYCSSFAAAIGAKQASNAVQCSMNLLATQFGIWDYTIC